MKTTGIQLATSSDALAGVDLNVDVVRDTDGLIAQGITIGETMNQNQALLLIANAGEIKMHPTIGVAIDELLLDDDYLRIKHRIRDNFSKDGLVVKNINLSNKKPLTIEASYE